MNKPSRLSVRIITRREPPPTPPALWPYWLLVGVIIGLWWAGWQVLS